MGYRRLTVDEKRLLRELYVAGTHQGVIAERFGCTRETVLRLTQDLGDRGYSVHPDGRVHKGKRGRPRKLQMQTSLF
jgi:DNA-binding MarR family transcriptional regulator